MHYNNWYYCNVIVYMVNDVNPYVSISASIGCYFCNIPPLIVCLYSHPFLWLWYKCNTPYMHAQTCTYIIQFYLLVNIKILQVTLGKLFQYFYICMNFPIIVINHTCFSFCNITYYCYIIIKCLNPLILLDLRHLQLLM